MGQSVIQFKYLCAYETDLSHHSCEEGSQARGTDSSMLAFAICLLFSVCLQCLQTHAARAAKASSGWEGSQMRMSKSGGRSPQPDTGICDAIAETKLDSVCARCAFVHVAALMG